MAMAFASATLAAKSASPCCSLAALGGSPDGARARASRVALAKEHLGACPALSQAIARPSRSSLAASSGARRGPLAAPRAAFGVEGKNVLVVNTSSGGHAIIGFWLAKRLRGFGHNVTVLTVGEESSPQMEKAPFNRFAELREVGVRTVWGSPASLAESLGVCDPFDVVLDNNGKDMAAVKPVVDFAQERDVKQFLFVSSAGIYKSTSEPPHLEGDAVKSDAGHTEVEQYIQSKYWSNGWAAFRPEYITGSGNNKDCEEWFFDRIVRDRPVPIPAPGIQLTVITHAADIADIITSAVNDHEAASGSIFNAVSGRAVTFDGLVRLCAKAAGMEPKIVHYDPAEVGVDVKKAFPFRNTHFYAEPRAVREKLGWSTVLSLDDILDARFEEYVAKGRYEKEMSFELDDKILAAVGKSV